LKRVCGRAASRTPSARWVLPATGPCHVKGRGRRVAAPFLSRVRTAPVLLLSSEARPGVVPRDVDVRAVGLLRTRRRTTQVNVGPQEVLDADELARGELENQELVRGSSIGKARRARKRGQAEVRGDASSLRAGRLAPCPAGPCRSVERAPRQSVPPIPVSTA